MFINFRPFVFPVLCFALLSCSKESVSPGTDDTQNINSFYELTSITYFMAEGDGIDTATVKLPGFEVSNEGNTIDKRDIKVNYDELVKKSLFMIDQANAVPEGMVLDTFKIRVPANWDINNNYTLSPDVFPLTTEAQEVLYDYASEDVMHVTIPPASKIAITAAIDVYNLKCSFSAVFKDQTTGLQQTVTGKWNGTLRYNNLSVEVKEHPAVIR